MWRLFSFFRKKPLLDVASSEQVVASIRAAEAETTGEIRVCIESRCSYMDAIDRAVELFIQLGMDRTEHRNGVLLYLALQDHQFAVYGDTSIYKAGGEELWQHAAADLQQQLRTGNVAAGLCACIIEIGVALSRHFPPDPAVEKNELPDEIIFGK